MFVLFRQFLRSNAACRRKKAEVLGACTGTGTTADAFAVPAGGTGLLLALGYGERWSLRVTLRGAGAGARLRLLCCPRAAACPPASTPAVRTSFQTRHYIRTHFFF